MKQRTMAIDALNQCLGPHNGTLKQWLKRTAKEIKRISSHAMALEMNPIFVIDGVRLSAENKKKWFKRKEQEFSTSKNAMKPPLNADILLGALIIRSGADLIVDFRHDADDVLASIALQSSPDSLVLSRDKDFFRYGNGALEGRVFGLPFKKEVSDDGKYAREKLTSILQNKRSRGLSPLDDISGYEPTFVPDHASLLVGKLSSRDGEVHVFERAAAYPRAELFGHLSLHMAARSFRQNIYTQPTRESFPTWDDSKVVWVDEIVKPKAEENIEVEPRIIAKELLARVGGAYNRQHTETATLLACELAAHGLVASGRNQDASYLNLVEDVMGWSTHNRSSMRGTYRTLKKK